MKTPKKKLCADENCDNTFIPFKTTDKYCSFTCSANNVKPIKRTGLYANKTLKEKKDLALKWSQNLLKKRKANAFERQFQKSKKVLRERIIKKHGKLICERCNTDTTIQFSTHHIIYRSEKPKHPKLNRLRNLIHLCFDCHEWFHDKKINRNYIVIERKLWELFGFIYGCESESMQYWLEKNPPDSQIVK